MRRADFLALGVVAVATLAQGCYEEKLKLRLVEDGSGVLRLERRLDPASSATELLGAATDEERSARARDVLLDELACWDGAAVWTGTRSAVRQGRVSFEASAYFEDVTKLRRRGPDGVSQSFSLSRAHGDFEVEWTWSLRTRKPPETLEQCRRLARSRATLYVEATISVPGPLYLAEGAEEMDDRSATWILYPGAELEREVARLEERVSRGELAERDAVLAIRPRLERRTIVATCPGCEVPSDRAAFRRELDAALAGYAGSSLAREVEARRLRRSKSAGGSGAY